MSLKPTLVKTMVPASIQMEVFTVYVLNLGTGLIANTTLTNVDLATPVKTGQLVSTHIARFHVYAQKGGQGKAVM